MRVGWFAWRFFPVRIRANAEQRLSTVIEHRSCSDRCTEASYFFAAHLRTRNVEAGVEQKEYGDAANETSFRYPAHGER
jgi:uncharacterized membrane protein